MEAFGGVFAWVFDGAGSDVFLTFLAGESWWTLAGESSAGVKAFALMETWIADCAWPLILLATTTHESGLAFAMKIGPSMLALCVIPAWLTNGTRSDILLAIFALKAGWAHALVIFSLIDAFGVIFTWLFRASLRIYLAFSAFETRSAMAIEFFAFIDASSFILAQALFFLGRQCAWTFVHLAIGSFESGFASATVFCSHV